MRTTLEQLYSLTIPEIQEAFLRAMQGAVDRAMLDEMVAAIEAGDVERLFAASGYSPAVLIPVLDRIEQTYRAAGEDTVSTWPRRIVTPGGTTVVPIFNIRNPVVEQELRQNSSEFITRISEEARENVRQVMQDGMARGENPRKVALDIVGRIDPSTGKRTGGVIGLSNQQERWAASAQRYLTTLDNQYFTLGLRDKRFDPTVRKAIESGKPLPADVVSKLTTAYKQRALRYRGEMIGRTEALHAIQRAEWLAHQAEIDAGNLVRQQVKKWWADSHDGRTRHTHRQLGVKYNRDRPIDMDEPFISPSGSRMMHPGDSSLGASPAELILCRCGAQYEVDWMYHIDR